ncbi:MAG TPA: hypothetical protein VI382_08230, partial [Candidatus Manganitrophaceae bacterium]|nr:hypothetical protein [Candidatus Manganitrophaceae bacterium]
MSPHRRKLVLFIFAFVSVVGATGLIYIGYQLFQARPSIFWVFSAYVTALTGIVIFFAFRLIGMGASSDD